MTTQRQESAEIVEARRRVNRARYWALQVPAAPAGGWSAEQRSEIAARVFYGTAACQLADVYGSERAGDTAATDGERIYWNAAFVATLTDEEVRGVLLHETGHCAHLHLWRLTPDEIGNVAGDEALNRWLARIPGVKLPDGALCSERFDGMSEERIMRTLYGERAAERGQSKPKPDGNGNAGSGSGTDGSTDGSSPDGSGSGASSNAGKPDPNGTPRDVGGCGTFLKPAASEQGKPDASADGTGKGETAGSGSNASKGLETPANGNSTSAPSAAPLSAREKWERAAIQAGQAVKAAGVGSLPGELAADLERVRAGAVDWRAALADFARNAVSVRKDWRRSARRFQSSRFVVPSVKRDNVGKLAGFRDVSGSIFGNPRLLAAFSAEFEAACVANACAASGFDFDTRVKLEWELEAAGDQVPLAVRGGGGTDFRPAFERLAERIADGEVFAGVVVLTDGYGTEPEAADVDALGIPVLWISTGAELESGRTVRVDESELGA